VAPEGTTVAFDVAPEGTTVYQFEVHGQNNVAATQRLSTIMDARFGISSVSL
jgi:hypothetical protein